MKKVIIYLHGFNSASLDLSGKLLISKQKLVVLNNYCKKNQILFYTPNVDYRDYTKLIDDLTGVYHSYLEKGYEVIFMGSSLGGFTCEYMAIKTNSTAIMINPAITPSELLQQFIGVEKNYEIQQDYSWDMANCEQFERYEDEIKRSSVRSLLKVIFVDLADELIDAQKTLERYQGNAKVIAFEGGSHGFEHINEALPIIEKQCFGDLSF